MKLGLFKNKSMIFKAFTPVSLHSLFSKDSLEQLYASKYITVSAFNVAEAE